MLALACLYTQYFLEKLRGLSGPFSEVPVKFERLVLQCLVRCIA
jgi:hypothetical protein